MTKLSFRPRSIENQFFLMPIFFLAYIFTIYVLFRKYSCRSTTVYQNVRYKWISANYCRNLSQPSPFRSYINSFGYSIKKSSNQEVNFERLSYVEYLYNKIVYFIFYLFTNVFKWLIYQNLFSEKSLISNNFLSKI